MLLYYKNTSCSNLLEFNLMGYFKCKQTIDVSNHKKTYIFYSLHSPFSYSYSYCYSYSYYVVVVVVVVVIVFIFIFVQNIVQ